MAKESKSKGSDLKSVNRRGFLKGAAASAAVAVTKPEALGAQPEEAAPVENASAPVMPRPGPAQGPIAVEGGAIVERPGSDFMVDVLKSLDFDYIFSAPANTFGDLHESIINYGGFSSRCGRRSFGRWISTITISEVPVGTGLAMEHRPRWAQAWRTRILVGFRLMFNTTAIC